MGTPIGVGRVDDEEGGSVTVGLIVYTVGFGGNTI